MVQLTAVDAQKPCWFYPVKLLQHASSRFTMISMSRSEICKANFRPPCDCCSIGQFIFGYLHDFGPAGICQMAPNGPIFKFCSIS